MYEFDRSDPVTVVLRAHSGSVDVVAEERGTVEVDVQPHDGSDAGLEAVRNTRVELADDTLLVQANGTDNLIWRRRPRLRITIRVPAGSALAGKSASADVRAAGLYSTVRLNVASAAVTVSEATGDVQLEAASGDLAVSRVGGVLRAKVSSGALNIGDVIGDVIAETASGPIRVGSCGGSLRAKTASGAIEIGMLRQGEAVIGTASGDVQVGVAAGSAVWMDLSSASGRSTSDLTARGETPPTDGPVELQLRVRTASGDIRVHRAAGDAKAVA
jgi:DUF4097 and DUF4098 domain-containing protein YvlB